MVGIISGSLEQAGPFYNRSFGGGVGALESRSTQLRSRHPRQTIQKIGSAMPVQPMNRTVAAMSKSYCKQCQRVKIVFQS
jgi:hypothetical protein